MPRWFIILLKVVVTALILAFFAKQFDIRSAGRSLTAISPYAIFMAIIVVLATTVAAAARLVTAVASLGARLRLEDSFRLTLESMFFSHTFISFLGGDALRVWRIRRLGFSLAKAGSVVVFDRLIGTAINHVFLLAALPWVLASDAGTAVKAILVILAAAGVAGFGIVLLLLCERGRAAVLAVLPRKVRAAGIAAFIAELSTLVRRLVSDHRRVAWILVLSTFVTLGNMLVFVLILSGLGVGFSMAVGCALLVPAIVAITMLPISLAGWGVREGASVLAFGAIGLAAEQALGGSIAFGLIVAAVSALGGILWLIDPREVTRPPMRDDLKAPPSLLR